MSFTNHALDQFLEDLMDIGIDGDMIVRLGSKSTLRTAPLQLSSQNDPGMQRRRLRYELIDFQKARVDRLLEKIAEHRDIFFQSRISFDQMLQHLQFSQEDGHFYDALSLPEKGEGETIVGRKGHKMQPDYLFQRWKNGQGAGAFTQIKSDSECGGVWQMPKPERLVQSKRIIACTTTAASMYASEIQSAAPGVIIVEEAGEILESHILAAMGSTTKQLIQIGDHKQLRPKAKNFRLSVEAGNGYDLNRSMFERLILQGRPSCTLLNQHRMRPEISKLIRHNYPELRDAPNTNNRPHLLGFQNDVFFVNHSRPEAGHNVLLDKWDPTMKSSKQNVYEVDMVLKCVRYLGQQNYKTDNIVILTPYLVCTPIFRSVYDPMLIILQGQLSLLRDRLSRDHDPILSDFDSHDLVEAGILPAASADVNKKPIRLSTIDNYQGEESDIVIASLTRSNEDGEIGFMAAPERLNVLISRARNALIVIGSAETFMRAAKGREEWTRLFDNLKSRGNIYDGFPVKCEKHPDRTVTVRTPDE